MGTLRKLKRSRRNPRPLPALSPGDDADRRIDLDPSELGAILEHAKTALSEDEYTKLHAAMETLVFLTQELEKKRVSIQRLKHLLFGATTETTRQVLQKILDQAGPQDPSGQKADPQAAPGPAAESQEKPHGHGRNGAEAYVGAEKVCVPHESLKPGDPCPLCKKGTVYESVEPGRLVRIQGQAPLGATVYELQKLRCHLCGEIFTARTPPGVGTEKYDAESASMIALLKYGTGLPFNRLQRLEGSLGVPLPATTQWEIVSHGGLGLEPALDELIRQAAQGDIFHNPGQLPDPRPPAVRGRGGELPRGVPLCPPDPQGRLHERCPGEGPGDVPRTAARLPSEDQPSKDGRTQDLAGRSDRGKKGRTQQRPGPGDHLYA